MSELYIGQRISFSNDLCTVRYIGPVEGTKGTWLGVEWDVIERGKHDGQANGKRHFKCLSTSATAGSFVRPNRAHDTPRSFIEALKYKYAPESIELAFAVGNAPSSRPIVISGKEVEEIGFDKVRKQLAELSELRIVIIDGLCIRAQKDAGWQELEIRTTCSNITELDLSRNLFEDWQEILPLITPLKKLQVLRLDGNRFRQIDLTAEQVKSYRQVLGSLRELTLLNTLLTWPEVCQISALCGTLSSLSLANNEYTSIPSTPTPYYLPQSLTSINLEWNDFTALSDVRPLQDLKNLTKLTLKHNSISRLSSVDSALEIKFSPALIELDISYNKISEWDIVNSLALSFPGLTALRVSHNPLFTSLRNADNGNSLSAADGFMLAMARMPKVRTLNYTPVTAKDRLNSESFYLSQIAAELRQTREVDETKVLESHPRWKELCEEYGQPDIVRKGERRIDPNSLQARLVTCHFHRFSPPLGDGQPDTWTVELPASLSMYAVHGLVGHAFKLAPAMLRLVYETGEPEMVQQRVDSVNDTMCDSSWDSDDEISMSKDATAHDTPLHEVELIAGTRTLGTWLEGADVTIRVDTKSSN